MTARPVQQADLGLPRATALLVLSAVLLGLAFEPVGWWPLAYVALVPVGVAAARGGRATRTGGIAAVVFIVWWLVQTRWLLPLGASSWLGASVVEGFMCGVGVWVIAKLRRRWLMSMYLAVPLGWVTMDFLRGRFPFGGFGWFTLAHTQAPSEAGAGARLLVQTADLFGEPTAGLLVAMTSGLIVDVMLTRRRHRKRLARRGLVWLAVMSAALVYGAWRVQQHAWVTTPGPVITVVQTNQPLNNQALPSVEEEAQQWRRLVDATLAAAQSEPRPALIVWPESAVLTPLNDEALSIPDVSMIRQMISEIARQGQVHLLVNASAVDEDGRYNSVYHVLPDGRFADERYDKVHLVPFGEYIPGSQALPWIKDVVLRHFSPWDWDHTLTAGRRRVAFDMPMDAMGSDQPAAPVRVVTPICFEDAFSSLCRWLVYPKRGKAADVLVNQTNGGWYAWFGDDGQAHPTSQNRQHLQIATLRSIENRVPTARAVNTGISGFIDSVGRIGPVVEVGGKQQMVFGSATHRVALDRRWTLYGVVGDAPMWVLTGVTLLLALVGHLRKHPISR